MARLEMRHIVKQFPKVLANDDVSIELRDGEILGLLGENGAGKSTLMNILFGLYKPTSGSILLDGKQLSFSSPRDAISNGLGMVHQHFMLVDTLSVTENIILGVEPARAGFIDRARARREVVELSREYGLEIDPDERIEFLPVGLQQRVEILKALYRRAGILILDEPTAVLTPQEVQELFDVVRALKERGVSIIIITHKLEEVKEICDRVYVLRRGRLVGERDTAEVTKEELAHLMVGREVVLTVERELRRVSAPPVFELQGVSVRSDKGIEAVRNLSLAVRPGEIVGIAGVDGNGQTELAEAVVGLRRFTSGSMLYAGREVSATTTRERMLSRISYVPADRQLKGLVLPMSVAENLVMGAHDRPPFSRGIALNFPVIASYSRELVDSFDIRTPSVDIPVAHLSGGNQQKVILAREFSRDPRFLLISQPTRGLDVGAIEYIHSRILAMREADVAILLISLELEEIFALSDRILVIYEGRIAAELDPSRTNENEVGLYMTGGAGRKERA